MHRAMKGGGAVICIAAVVFLASVRPGVAQGRGNAFGHGGRGGGVTASGPSAAGSSVPSEGAGIPGRGVRNFASWLDDATVMEKGSGYLNLGFGWWKTPSYHEFDVPMIDTGVAVNRRVQFGASLPVFHASEPGGPVVRGLGTTYLSAKIQLRDPSSHSVGFGVTPALEILNSAPEPGDSRVSWALPASIEVQRQGWRAYGSTGYFSRGALFASGALELALSDSAWMTGAISHSYSVHPDSLSAALGLAQTRTDVTGGVTVAVHPSFGVYGTVGRTISKQDANSASLMLTLGVSMNFNVR